MSTLQKTERIIRTGLYSLCDTLYQEWPLPEGDTKNEISEANLSIHLAHAFLSQDYCGFSEYRTASNGHYDLVLFHPEQSEYVIVECKRFLKTDDTGLNSDFDRLLKQSELLPAVGVLVAMTQFKSVRDWWLDPNRIEIPDGRKSARWAQMAELLKTSSSVVGHVPMPHHGDESNAEEAGFFHEALYAIFPLGK